MKNTDRRTFIKAAGLTMTGAAALPFLAKAGKMVKSPEGVKLGLASYTFRKFSLPQTLDYCSRINLKYLSLKSMHLPLDSTPEKISEVKEMINAKGINLHSVGVIYMKDKGEVDQAFEYAKNAGVGVIVGVPDHELLDYTEGKVKSYNIKMAIHNHGPVTYIILTRPVYMTS